MAQRADLAEARTLYNKRQFDGAIEAAKAAQKMPATADAATVVLARAHLERYRERANPDDLSAARVALGTVRVSNLDSRDHVDFLMALGEALFFEDDYGAAATLFESGIDRAIAQGRRPARRCSSGGAARSSATPTPSSARAASTAFRRLRERMSRELARNPGSAAAAYFLVVARGAAASPSRPGMPRSPAGCARGWPARARRTLRADLDKLVLEGIIPDRVAALSAERREQAESDLRGEWAVVKERWK